MSGSSSEDEIAGDHVFYRDRPEWKDIQPIPQDEEDPVVAIDYSPQFTDVFDYFRAVVKKGEKSKRALKLTQDAVKLNPANYTVWQYRREILMELAEDLQAELNFVGGVILKQPKNYQVWQHRRILVEWLKDPSQEKNITECAINKDAKNYHAWQHRQWVVKKFSLYEGELDFTEKLIEIDVRNNSAWNHRYFTIKNSTGFTEAVCRSEIDFTLKNIQKAKENESSWSYLRGLMLHNNEGLSGNEDITSFCEQLYESGNRSIFLLSNIIDMCKEQANKNCKDPKYPLNRGINLCEELATKLDIIRANYWNYIGDNLRKLLS
ncbi:protein farnesyltransferase/geranylgeranyltransferase type-1 subunit alpha [Coccinella septempunctata]|uniref:protein farnesyltransferase/geranylgeranyltransferase type-1 subunit alpha n=1 Tax=Coccinella septempunctata TaxID=41139 RepID=UPI001D0914AD|nr:protein farnesyltransferase/geranylgeranyltransferase type-1 subunit alpha [Coccinella septempunctata]